MMSFINNLDYLRGYVPVEEDNWKRLKCLIDTDLLMEAHTREKSKIIFDNFWKFLASLLSILLLMTFLL